MTSLATSPNTNENINTPAFAPDSNSSSITPGTIASPSINIPCPEDSNNDDDPSTKLTGSSSNNVSNDSSTNLSGSSSNNVSDDSNTSEPENTASSSSPSDGVAPWVKTVFNATVLNILFWLITIYIIYRLGLAIFAKKPADAVSSGQLGYSRTIDITLALVIVLALMGSYYSLPEDEQDNLTGYTIEWTYNFFNDPWSLLILIWFTITIFKPFMINSVHFFL